MLKELRGGLAAALVMVACASTVARADDREDIKASGQAFAKALQDGDSKEAHKYAITDEQSSKVLDVMTQLASSHKKMTDAAVAKFGEQGKSLFGGQNPAMRGPEQIAKQMDDADVKVDGNTATITAKNPPPGQPAQPIIFQKEGGTWKLDFTKLPSQERMAQGLPMMEKMATAMSETADDIKAGKYASVQEARMGFLQKVRSAMGAPGAGGRPGGAPGGER